MSPGVCVCVCVSPGLLFPTLTYLFWVELRSRLTDGPTTHTCAHTPLLVSAIFLSTGSNFPCPPFSLFHFPLSPFFYFLCPNSLRFNHSVITKVLKTKKSEWKEEEEKQTITACVVSELDQYVRTHLLSVLGPTQTDRQKERPRGGSKMLCHL